MIVAGNWKMYAGPDPQALAKRLAGITGVDAIVCPPYTALAACVEAGLTTFAQNVHWEAEGAFTGEISPAMLAALGVTGALVGHSERRQYFGETDEGVARRAKAALDAGLSVIACVGETQEERDAGETETVLRIQVEAIAAACGPHERLVIAYEPVWAIGTGRTATPEIAQEAHAVRQVAARPAGSLRRLGEARERRRAVRRSRTSTARSSAERRSSIEVFAAICELAAAAAVR